MCKRTDSKLEWSNTTLICFKHWDMQFWLKFGGKFHCHISSLVICWGGAELYFYSSKKIKELCRNNGTKEELAFPKSPYSFGVHRIYNAQQRGKSTCYVNFHCQCVYINFCCLDFVMAAGFTDSFFQDRRLPHVRKLAEVLHRWWALIGLKDGIDSVSVTISGSFVQDEVSTLNC